MPQEQAEGSGGFRDVILSRVSPAPYSGPPALGSPLFLSVHQLFNLGLGTLRGRERPRGVVFTVTPRRGKSRCPSSL